MNMSLTGLVPIVLLAPLALAQERSTADSFRASADAYLTELSDQGRWQGSVLVVRGGKTLLRKGYGTADKEHGVPNTPETKFRIGSLTKAFTAAGILLLDQRGALRTGDALCVHLLNLA